MSPQLDTTSGGGPRIRDVTAHAYRFPTLRPESDGTLDWEATTMVVVELELDDGDIRGLGWTYADVSCVPLITNVLADVVRGRPVLDMPAAWHAMQRQIRNLGRPGIVSTALSAMDIAIWDAASRWLGLPLSRLLGRCHDSVAVYGSGGFTSETDQQLTDELIMWCDQRAMPRVKIKIGESFGQAVDRDMDRIQLAREVIGERTALYVDANGGYSVGQAKRMAGYLDDQGVEWFEEPVSSDDLAGLAMIRLSCRADVAAGEYGYDLSYFSRMLPAVDCLQVDITRCGGYTEWMRIAATAAAYGRDVSAHCAPNLSVHCAVATPNFRHIEWFFDHERLESELFDGTVDPTGGRAEPRRSAGHGLSLRTAEAEPYAVEA